MKLAHYIQRFKNIFTEGYKYTKYSTFPVGHYYSPIVNLDDYKNTKQPESPLLDIELNEKGQLEIMQAFTEILTQGLNWDNYADVRYSHENNWFPKADSIFLYCMMRHFSPKKIIEVGSGFSSALMLDVNSAFLNDQVTFTFIEPNPKRLKQLLKKDDFTSTTIIEKNVQTVSLDVFKALQKNDFLFIDSSHITKTGSDVNFILFNVLPILPSGVIIHFHDIFYPFEYPEDWIMSGKNWNEIYLLRAFLQNNKEYEIVTFVDFMKKKHPQFFESLPDLSDKKNGSSIYILKK